MKEDGLSKKNTDNLANMGEFDDVKIKKILDDLYKEEQHLSYRRRIIHGKIDILRAELTERLKKNRERGKPIINGEDINKLSEILAKGKIDKVGKAGPINYAKE